MVQLSAQTSTTSNPEQGKVLFSQLSPPAYPPLARQARITGDVQLTLSIGKDGRVQSVLAVNGHPMLKQAAQDSATQSQFECTSCDEAGSPRIVIYMFRLVEEECCKATSSTAKLDREDVQTPQVSQSGNRVTVLDRAVCFCDPGPDTIKVRSPKCLYLWRCATRYGL